MTPSTAIFNAVYIGCKKTSTSIYDYLPKERVPYPFIYIDGNNSKLMASSDILGSVEQRIHVYGKRVQRLDLDKLHEAIKANIDFYNQELNGYYLTTHSIQDRTIQDNTDVEPLLHIVLDVTISFTRKD